MSRVKQTKKRAPDPLAVNEKIEKKSEVKRKSTRFISKGNSKKYLQKAGSDSGLSEPLVKTLSDIVEQRLKERLMNAFFLVLATGGKRLTKKIIWQSEELFNPNNFNLIVRNTKLDIERAAEEELEHKKYLDTIKEKKKSENEGEKEDENVPMDDYEDSDSLDELTSYQKEILFDD